MKSLKIKPSILVMFLILGGLTSCVDDNILMEDPSSSIEKVEEDEYGIGFFISLDNLGNETATRSEMTIGGTNEENYIDPNNIRVIICDEYARFLYEVDDSQVKYQEQSSSTEAHQWFVRIPTPELYDDIRFTENDGTVNNGNLKERLSINKFKIAVLANWPKYDDPQYGTRYARYRLYPGESLSHLSHFYLDDAYKDEDGEDAFGHLVVDGNHVPERFKSEYANYQPDHYYMGTFTNWVDFSTYGDTSANFNYAQSIVEDYIRNNYNVKNSYIKGKSSIDYEFKNLWKIWNFGGNENLSNDIFYGGSNSNRENWAAHNETNWYEQHIKETIDTENKGIAQNISLDGLDFVGPSNTNNFTGVRTDKGIGLQMPRFPMDNYKNGEPINERLFHFMADADGYINVKVGAYISNNNSNDHKVYLGTQIQEMVSSSTKDYQATNKARRFLDDSGNINDDILVTDIVKNETPTNGHFTEPINLTFRIDVTYYPLDIYFTSLCENGDDRLVIYEIEYIKSRHLYDVDRMGIVPSQENPIPMYGVQDFDPIGEYWEPGILFNLSAYNGFSKPGYIYRNIYLLRSLAKVEFWLPKNKFLKPSSVFLRSSNRTARCAPLDVFTPTDIIWNGYKDGDPRIGIGENGEYFPYNVGGVDQEIENIQKFGPAYEYLNDEEHNPSSYLKDFRTRYSWYFGIWNYDIWDWGWNQSEKSEMRQPITSEDVLFLGNNNTEIRNPRILNTSVNRSDYAHFKFQEDPEYWKYVIYVPEKNICDADDPGQLGDRPKLMHIEFRFPGNPDDNMDNNSAYRLYFTKNGAIDKVARNEMDDWELDYNKKDIIGDLKQYWPVIRNHVYRFKLTGLNQGDVQLEVRNSASREIIIPDFN